MFSEQALGLVEEEDRSPETGREVGALAGRGGAQLQQMIIRCLERLVDGENDVEEIEFRGKPFQSCTKLRNVTRPASGVTVTVHRVAAECLGFRSSRVGDAEI